MSWLNELFNAIDQSDAEAFANFLTDDARFQLGNNDEVLGKENIRDAVAGFFSSIKSTKHTLNNSWIIDNNVFIKGEVTYTRQNDTTLSVPFADILELNDRKIQDYRVYIDISELYAS